MLLNCNLYSNYFSEFLSKPHHPKLTQIHTAAQATTEEKAPHSQRAQSEHFRQLTVRPKFVLEQPLLLLQQQ